MLILAPFLPKIWRMRANILRDWQFYLLAAVTGVVTYHVAVYLAAHSSGAHDLPLIATFSGVFVMLGSPLFGKPVTKIQIGGGLLACLGLAVLLGKGDMAVIRELDFVVGDLWMLFGAMVWALYSLLIERRPAATPFVSHATVILFALPLLGCLYAAEAYVAGPFVVDLKLIVILLFLGLLPSVVCYWLWMGAVERLGAVRTHALYYTLPLFAAAEAWLLLDEPLFWYHAVAAVLIISGAMLATWRKAT